MPELWVGLAKTKHTYGFSSEDEGSQPQSSGSSKPFKGVATSVHSVLVDQCRSSVSGPKSNVFSARQPLGSHLSMSGRNSHLPSLEHRKRVDISASQISECSEIVAAPMRVSPLSQILHSWALKNLYTLFVGYILGTTFIEQGIPSGLYE